MIRQIHECFFFLIKRMKGNIIKRMSLVCHCVFLGFDGLQEKFT